ncbi:MAG: hypothetical protein WED08_01360 [Patescibacteria group bacterium]
MKIKNPVLRFGAGLLAVALAITVLVFLLYGVGMLAEKGPCAGDRSNIPCAYDWEGFGFWTAVLQGYGMAFAGVLAVWLLWFSFRIVRWAGNRFFGPK